MSYCSENKLPITTPISRIREIVDLLKYEKVKDICCVENQIGSYMWFGDDESISFVGVELSIYKYEEYISVQTRSRSGGSFWDLKQQNKTISLLKSLFGGSFETDEGVNRYMDFHVSAPSKVSCALYVARWAFKNAMIKPKLYLDARQMPGDIAREDPTGLPWIDEMNPRVLSHNMLIPYIIACWESFLRQSYIAIIKYADDIPEKALRNCKITAPELLSVIKKEDDLVSVLADSLSFQRPSVAAENFRQLNIRIDIKTWLCKPYHKRKTTLFDAITELVELRNAIVHVGEMSQALNEKKVRAVIDDLAEAADRIYIGFSDVFNFVPRKDY